MKLIILFLLLFSFNVKGVEINLNDINSNYEKITYVEVTDLENIDKLSNLINLKEIYIKNVNIEDISILNNFKYLEKVRIYYSKVNLSRLNNSNIKEMDIIGSYIINDDFSSLANSDLKILDLQGSYITSIYTLKNVISLEELTLSSITNLRSLEPITNLPKLKTLNFGGSEDLITDKVLNYIKKNNITGTNYDETQYMHLDSKELNQELDEIIESLNLDNLSDIDKIKEITLYVVDNITYDEECGVDNKCEYNEINFNSLRKSLTGSGVCYHYALLTNELLNRVGIKSYLVSGYTKAGLGHEWLNIYLDDKWYGLDPTWIDFEGRASKLRKTGKCAYFMVELTKNNSFYKEHLEDVLPSNIVDVNAVIVDEVIIEDDSVDTYEIVFISSIIVLVIFIVIKVYKKSR